MRVEAAPLPGALSAQRLVVASPPENLGGCLLERLGRDTDLARGGHELRVRRGLSVALKFDGARQDRVGFFFVVDAVGHRWMSSVAPSKGAPAQLICTDCDGT